MKLVQTVIPDVVIIEPQVFSDERGWFMESFNEQRLHAEMQALGLSIPCPFVQDNYSCSKKGVLRGLHYQRSPYGQGKLVGVLCGAAFDVAVDIRQDSPTFGQWVSQVLSAENKRMLWIPEGFAHGFLALTDGTHFAYKTTNYYMKESEMTIRWDDPHLAIKWPRDIPFILSEKDREAKILDSFKV